MYIPADRLSACPPASLHATLSCSLQSSISCGKHTDQVCRKSIIRCKHNDTNA